MSDYGLALFGQHAALLEASAITPHLARRRGYVTVDTKVRLDGLGIAKAGRNAPGLLIPLLRKDGSTWGYQYRPDEPRLNDAGKPVKYETPVGQSAGLDVPPGVGPLLDDPTVPLWITEGSRKADSAAELGLACVALLGVWMWRGSNARKGKVALAEWHDVALNGRRVVLAFDSDVMTKKAVSDALVALAGYLGTKGAKVEYLHLPQDSGKAGLDDYIAAGHGVDDLLALVRPDAPVSATRNPGATDSVALTSTVAQVAEVALSQGWDGTPGDELLDEVADALREFVAFPSPAVADAVALWVAHTHALDAFDSSPRLALISPEPQSGKTRTLEVAERLVDRPMMTANTTVAVLARSIDAGRTRTVMLDEADAVFGAKAAPHEELRAILNSGHRRGASYERMVGEGAGMQAKSFQTFAAVALAGIGDLPDTVMQRSVVVRMRRRAPDERVQPYRRRLHGPELDLLRDRLAGWVREVADEVGKAYPALPDHVTDRPADVWEPLLALADAAGGTWPERARTICVELVNAAVTTDSGSLGVRLLGDLRELFGDAETMHTDVILERLHDLDEAPWSDLRGKPLDARGLARRLRQYDARPVDVKVEGVTRKGYRREHLHDAWSRYLSKTASLPAHPPESATSATSATPQVSEPPEVADRLRVAHSTATEALPWFDQLPKCDACQAPTRQPSRALLESGAPNYCGPCGRAMFASATSGAAS